MSGVLMRKIRLATRGSPLALIQTRMAEDFLRAHIGGGVEFERVIVKTSGDKRQDWSLEKFGGKGLFTKEIEDALLSGEADLAVHSAKDLPSNIPEGLVIAGCLPRDACRDVLAVRDGVSVPSLIASGSPRRRAQLKKIFPQAVWTEFRGNVETRLGKIAAGEADATILSEAGLKRLGIDSFGGIKFSPVKVDICVPAVGQGIVAFECRSSDLSFYSPLTDPSTNEIFSIEREFLTALGGGCQAAYAANCDGLTFRFFHENTGFQKIEFDVSATLVEKLALVRELALGVH